MNKETIVSILESEGIKGGAKGLDLPDGRELDTFIRSSADMMTVGRISHLELQDKFICFQNRKGERFFFAYEDVVGFRVGKEEGGKDRSAGFNR